MDFVVVVKCKKKKKYVPGMSRNHFVEVLDSRFSGTMIYLMVQGLQKYQLKSGLVNIQCQVKF